MLTVETRDANSDNPSCLSVSQSSGRSTKTATASSASKSGWWDSPFSSEEPWMSGSDVSPHPRATPLSLSCHAAADVSVPALLRLFPCLRSEWGQLHLPRRDVSHAEGQPDQAAQ